jgi:hypothetical protein
VLVVADLADETQNDQNNHNENDHEYHGQTFVSIVWSRGWCGCWCWCGRWRRRYWSSGVVERILTLTEHKLRRGEISVVSCALSNEKLSCLSASSVILNKVSKVVGEEGSSEYLEICCENIEIASSKTVYSGKSRKRHR